MFAMIAMIAMIANLLNTKTQLRRVRRTKNVANASARGYGAKCRSTPPFLEVDSVCPASKHAQQQNTQAHLDTFEHTLTHCPVSHPSPAMASKTSSIIIRLDGLNLKDDASSKAKAKPSAKAAPAKPSATAAPAKAAAAKPDASKSVRVTKTAFEQHFQAYVPALIAAVKTDQAKEDRGPVRSWASYKALDKIPAADLKSVFGGTHATTHREVLCALYVNGKRY